MFTEVVLSSCVELPLQMHNNNSFALALFNTIFKQTIRKQMNKKTRSYQKNVRIRFAFAPCVWVCERNHGLE